jgi:hypothetical protein
MWQRKNLRPWVTDPELMAKYQGIVAAKQDRLSREDWRDEADLRRWAEDNGKTLFIVDRNLWWPPRDDANHDDDVSRWNDGAEAAHREWNMTSRRYKRMHRALIDDNLLVGKPTYGYQITPVEGTKHKTLTIYEPQARVVREAVARYLGSESVEKIANDFNDRGILSPGGKRWHQVTMANLLRNPALAGRRMNNWGKDEKQRKTILRFPGIITWAEHEQILARLASRAHRKGISPSNTSMLTGTIRDEAGHPMYRSSDGHGNVYYKCRLRCGFGVPFTEAEEEVTRTVIDYYGHLPRMVRRLIPGKNHFDEMARLRQDRVELDDLADDYDRRHAEITAEIRRLSKLPAEPDQVKWVRSGKTVAQHWEALDGPGRRDWLRENGWTVTAVKRPKEFGRWSLVIDAGFTAEISAERQAESFGFPIAEVWKVPAKLGHHEQESREN